MNLIGFYKFGIIFQVIAIVHFIRRRPDNYWLWIILIGGGLGALAYIVVEVLPDLGLLRDSFRIYSHRKRITALETMVLDNPSAGNYQELADLYREQKKFAKAKECYDRAISTRTDSPDPFYRRALCEIELNDFAAAATDLEHVVNKDRNYDYQRASGLLAYAWAQTGRSDQAGSLFAKITETSTLSETQYNYGVFLAAQFLEPCEIEACPWRGTSVLSLGNSSYMEMKRAGAGTPRLFLRSVDHASTAPSALVVSACRLLPSGTGDADGR